MKTTMEKINIAKNFIALMPPNEIIGSQFLSYVCHIFNSDDNANEIYDFLKYLSINENNKGLFNSYKGLFSLSKDAYDKLTAENLQDLFFDMCACDAIPLSAYLTNNQDLYILWLDKVQYIYDILKTNDELLDVSMTRYTWTEQLLNHAKFLFSSDAAYQLEIRGFLDLYNEGVLNDTHSKLKSLIDDCLTKSTFAYEFYINCKASTNQYLANYQNLYLICYNKIIDKDARDECFRLEFKPARLKYLIKKIHEIPVSDSFLIMDILNILYIKNPKCKNVTGKLTTFLKDLLFNIDLELVGTNIKKIEYLCSNQIIKDVCQDIVIDKLQSLNKLNTWSKLYRKTSYICRQYYPILFNDIDAEQFVIKFKNTLPLNRLAVSRNVDNVFRTILESTIYADLECYNVYTTTFETSNEMRNRFLDIILVILTTDIVYPDMYNRINTSVDLLKLFINSTNKPGLFESVNGGYGGAFYYNSKTAIMADFLYNEKFKTILDIIKENDSIFKTVLDIITENNYVFKSTYQSIIEYLFTFSENDVYKDMLSCNDVVERSAKSGRYSVIVSKEFGLYNFFNIPSIALVYAKLKKDYDIDYYSRYIKYNDFSSINVKHISKTSNKYDAPKQLVNNVLKPSDSLYIYYIILLSLLDKNIDIWTVYTQDMQEIVNNGETKNSIYNRIDHVFKRIQLGYDRISEYQQEFNISDLICDFICKCHLEYFTDSHCIDIFIDSASQHLKDMSRDKSGFEHTMDIVPYLYINEIKDLIKQINPDYYINNNVERFSDQALINKIEEVQDFLNIRALA